MSELANNFARSIMEFVNELRDQNLEWKRARIDDKHDLQEKEDIGRANRKGRAMEERIKYENAIKEQKLKHEQQMEAIKISGEHRLKNYKDFLHAVNDMKQDLRRLYPEMPLVTALLLHHHASDLLDKMWHEKDEYEHERLKGRFVKFLLAAQDDALSISSESNHIPRKMIELLEAQQSEH